MKLIVPLVHCSPGAKKSDWTFEIDNDRARLLNHRDKEVTSFEHSQAYEMVFFPSFVASEKTIRIRSAAESQLYDFEPKKAALQQLQAYVHATMSLDPAKGASTYRSWGILWILLGIVFCGVAAAIPVVFYLQQADAPAQLSRWDIRLFVWAGVAGLIGIPLFFSGIGYLWKASRVARQPAAGSILEALESSGVIFEVEE